MQLDEYLTQRLSIPTVQVDPFSALAIDADQEFSPIERPSLGTVIGLGLRQT